MQELTVDPNHHEEQFVYGVNETHKPGISGAFENYFIERQNVTVKEKAFFYNLFATLMHAGIGTIDSLKILANKTQNQKFKRIINTIVHDIEKGESLSGGMEKFANVFTNAEIGVIKSGEAIGALDKMLDKLAEQTEEQHELQTQLKSALTYPAIVFTILLIAVVIMFGFVIPKLVALFVENNVELPLLTKVMLFVSTVLTQYWGLVAIAIIIGFIIFTAYFNNEEGKFNLDLLKLKLPIAGGIFQKVYLIRFFSTLGLLLDAGVPLQETMRIIIEVIDNEVYRLKTFELKASVQKGEKISENLAKTPFLFPETTAKMIEIGEKSATIGDMSLKISKQYGSEVRYSLKNLSSVLGPIVIVIVGTFVAIFALAILSPVFKLTEGII